jgi:2,3-dihydroxybiphenyl 1,2-dioxygenase
MPIRALGYVGIASRNPQEWAAFNRELLGMESVPAGGSSFVMRLDERARRFSVAQADFDGCHHFGWEVDDAAGLDALGARLEGMGVMVAREPASLAEERCVAEVISFSDPAGNRLEAFHGARLADTAFRPSRAIAGFRTGSLGLGHAVLMVRDLGAMRDFYERVLGFHLSDYMTAPFTAYFYHVNGRHHSLALLESDRDGVHHLMAELREMDDVGHAWDIAQCKPDRIGVTLGRHSNDLMLSFYARTPSGFMFECGWGGRVVDPDTWRAAEVPIGPSLWGHDRHWLPPEKNRRALELRLQAAAEGLRHPVQRTDP